MKEVKISGYKKNAREEISFKILIKKGDYTQAEEELIKQCETNGDLLDLEFTGLLSSDPQKERNKKLQKLNGFMMVWCENENINIEEEKKKLYQRNRIETRKELTDSQLDEEIELYQNGILSH